MFWVSLPRNFLISPYSEDLIVSAARYHTSSFANETDFLKFIVSESCKRKIGTSCFQLTLPRAPELKP